MKRHAKAPSAGSTMRQAGRLGRFFRGAFATRAISRDSKGSGTPSGGRHGALAIVTAALVLAATVVLGTTALAVGLKPTVATEPATHVNPEHAYLEGTVNPNGEETHYWFEYGTTTSYGHLAPAVIPKAGETLAEAEAKYEGFSAGSGTEAILKTAEIGGLQPEATYHFRIVAKNASGTSLGLDEIFITATEAGPQSCPNEAIREQQHSTALPDCRAYEMVSPPHKNGADIVFNSEHTQAAATETPGLPMAVRYTSLTAFGDAIGTGISTEYIAQREATPGTSGWTTHAITPHQEGLSFAEAATMGGTQYTLDLSPDLTRGALFAPTPVPTASDPHENVAAVPNLYSRDDLRTPGAGNYTLVTDCALCAAPLPPLPPFGQNSKPWLAGTSRDFEHILFESKLDLTPEAKGNAYKVYKSDHGVVRLLTPGSLACAGLSGAAASRPCSAAGLGASVPILTPNVVSDDGSRAIFSSPIKEASNARPSTKPGAVSKLYQLNDSGTATAADDAVVQLNASEKATPEAAQAAFYQTASANGSRVFFTSGENLTESASGSSQKLYMWARQPEDEVQRLAVDAEGGTFTLTARTQPSVGTGNLTESSTQVEEVTGSFTVGQTIEGAGIQSGTTILAMGAFSSSSNSTLTLSKPAEATATGVELKAAMQATTGALPHNATAAEVQSAIAALHFAAVPTLPLYGEGNATVSGGPGGPGAATPYQVTFTGALAGVDVMQMTADPAGLTGAAHTATVTTTLPIHNLSLIAGGAAAVLGASEDGHRLYFAAHEQLVAGGPPIFGSAEAVFFWQDAKAPASLSFVADSSGQAAHNSFGTVFNLAPKLSTLTPDGKHLLFTVSYQDGESPTGYLHGSCDGNPDAVSNSRCSELYLYSAEGSTPLRPNLVCASCNPALPAAPGNAFSRYGPSEESSAGTPIGNSGALSFSRHLARSISDDGRFVFFTTRAALVPEDTNGQLDAYEYDARTEELHLLSSGTSDQHSVFLEASADGRNAFFTTAQRLTGWDTDPNIDLYDARVEGGLPEPPPPPTAPCEGASCRQGSSAAPAPAAIGSTQEGKGNPHHPRKPRKHRHKRRSHHRRPGTNRGGAK